MTANTMQRIALRLTSELEAIIEARRVELKADPRVRVQHTHDVPPAYAIRDLIVTGCENVYTKHAEIQTISGATTRTIALHIPLEFHGYVVAFATEYDLSTHATLRALIVAGAS